MQKKENSSCNFQESPVSKASELRPFHIRITKRIPNMMFTLKSRIKYYFLRNTTRKNPENQSLDLQVGDWVEVRLLREITSTLDEKGKFKGLYFMPEMEAFCGKKFKIFKKAEKIKLETNGELRKLRNPSYFLEGVHCTGIFQGGCDRACFHYWREEWLKKIPE
ncbi:MAG: hypothetical protein JEZ14_15400 [Marinilabiliaceae bacterium]|nr:hypothetical protein [Marinilabiliaceae bacterium]